MFFCFKGTELFWQMIDIVDYFLNYDSEIYQLSYKQMFGPFQWLLCVKFDNHVAALETNTESKGT